MATIDAVSDLKVNIVQLQKMAFLFNALENGWTIKRKDIEVFSYNKRNQAMSEKKEFSKH